MSFAPALFSACTYAKTPMLAKNWPGRASMAAAAASFRGVPGYDPFMGNRRDSWLASEDSDEAFDKLYAPTPIYPGAK
ncbi:MAG TPA: hypothetical protein VF749_00840 [Candidatus Acidoferrum sp.]